MKKYFKLLGLALLATSMFTFTACADDEEAKSDVNEATDGITVTFGDYTWKAKYSEGATTIQQSGLTSGRFFAIYATPNQSIGAIPIEIQDSTVAYAYVTYPMVYAMGKTSGSSDGNDVYIQYYEKDENTHAFQDEDEDWDLYGWEKGTGDDDDVKVTVTDFNSNTFVISGTVTGTLYEINANHGHTGNAKELKVVFKNIALEDADADDEEE
jgi:hypothetical protein